METIPKELVLLILSSGDVRDAANCMAVSKSFNVVCNDECLWKQFVDKKNYKKFGSYLDSYRICYNLEKFCGKANIKFEGVFDLVELSMSYKNLTTIPTELGLLTNLQRLFLNGNQLTTIPKELGQLVNLQGLCLNDNQLTTIPTELGLMTNLQKFVLDYNQLTTIPTELGQLTNLRGLWLYNNQLTTIPTELGQMTNLRGLYLNNNKNLQIESNLLAQFKATIPNLSL